MGGLAALERDFGGGAAKTPSLEQDFGQQAPKAPMTLGRVGQIVGEEAKAAPGRVVEGIRALPGAALETLRDPTPSMAAQFVMGGPAAGAVGAGSQLATKALPQIPGWLARIIGTGGVTAAENAMRGEDPLWGAARGTAGAAVAEGALAGIPRLKPLLFRGSSLKNIADQVAARKAEFTRSTQAIDPAFREMAPRIPPGQTFYVPALSPSPLTLDQVRAALHRAEDSTYKVALSQFGDELNALNATLSRSRGQQQHLPSDLARLRPERYQVPLTETEKRAVGSVKAMSSPWVRSAADVASSEDFGTGIPVGPAIPLSLLPGEGPSLSQLARGVVGR